MTGITPYGYYSLKEVFNKVGLAIFGSEWDNTASNFKEETTKAYTNQHFKSERGAIIPPITEDYLIEKVESFTRQRYSNEEINEMTSRFFSMHCSLEEQTFAQLGKNLNLKKSPKVLSQLTPDHRDTKLRVAKLQAITRGIKYAHIAKGLRQVIHSNFITGEIIDAVSGKQIELPKEFWLAKKPKFSFGTSYGIYSHMSSYDIPLNGKASPFLHTFEYIGTIVINSEQVDKFIEETFPQKKESKESNAGRKYKINWERFQIEAFRRLRNENNLPKQDAFAEDMRDWCYKEFGIKLGLSTVQGRLKPIYDMLKEPA